MKNQLKLKFKKELIKKVEVTKQELTNLKNNTRKKQKKIKTIITRTCLNGNLIRVIGQKQKKNKMKKLKFIKEKDIPQREKTC